MLWFGILTRSICCMGRCFSLHLPVLRIFCMGMLRGTRLYLGTTIWWRVIQEGLRQKPTAEWALTKNAVE